MSFKLKMWRLLCYGTNKNLHLSGTGSMVLRSEWEKVVQLVNRCCRVNSRGPEVRRPLSPASSIPDILDMPAQGRALFNDFYDALHLYCSLGLILVVLLDPLSLVRTSCAQWLTAEILSKLPPFHSWQGLIKNYDSSPGHGAFLELMKSLHMR